MANDNAPFGFKAVQDTHGSGNLTLIWFRIADNHTTSAIYQGDPVKLASGYALRITAGDAVAGVAHAFRYKVTSTGTSVEAKYYDGVTGKTDIWVGCTAPDLAYEVQHNTALSLFGVMAELSTEKATVRLSHAVESAGTEIPAAKSAIAALGSIV